MHKFRPGDYCRFILRDADDAPVEGHHPIVKVIKGHIEGLNYIRFRRLDLMKMTHISGDKSDWNGLAFCEPLSEAELLIIMCNPDYSDDYIYWNNEGI